MASSPYYITFNFPERYIRSGKERLTIQFKVNYLGDDLNITDPSAYGVRLLSTGTVDESYELDEFTLVSGEFSFTLYDYQGLIRNYLFSDEWWVLEKTGRVTYEINADGTWRTEFDGYIQPESVLANIRNPIIEITAGPRTDILNNTALWDGETPLNPLGYMEELYYPINDVITDIYNYVLTSPELKIYQEWAFHAVRNPEDPATIVSDISFDQIHLSAEDYFFNPNYKFMSFGELLKSLAFELGCFTGVINNKAYFRQLFATQENLILPLDNHLVIDGDYLYQDIAAFVKITDRFQLNYLNGNYTPISSQKIDKSICWYINDVSPTQLYGTWYYYKDGTTGWLPVYGVNTPVLNTNPRYLASYLSDYYWKYRGDYKNSKVIELQLAGTDYKMEYDYLWKGFKLHPYSIQKNFKANKTTVKMLFI
ncbi:MAG: hypothetical protein HUU43_10495 [Ignavibacteriaceae bacterium]|nr:hypothetical protein [Ignavibacteriaceae bacterium]NUM71268.1 hypothetical protein [Ignavibacteriaceae bacterium]